MKPFRQSAVLLSVCLAGPLGRVDAQTPYTFLQAGYTQEVFGATALATGAILGGVGFAVDGSVWAKNCGNTSGLLRFDATRTVTVNGTSIHPLASGSTGTTASACGMTNHPDGRLYLNTVSGAQRIDASTGAVLGIVGPPGNNYGITVDPQTNRLVYPAAPCAGTASCTLVSVDPAGGSSQNLGTFTFTAALEDVDGVTFDPTGNFIVVAGRTGVFPQDTPFLTILTRTGTIVRQLAAEHFPDGASFHRNPSYLVTNNNDGTISRYDFPGDDLRQLPVQTVIARGGFRGDLSGVGADGCLYATQAGTRYTNGAVTGENSVVRVCSAAGDFLPTPGVRPDVFIKPDGVVNASGYQPKLAPDTVFTIFGGGMGPSTIAIASAPSYPTTLGGTSVTFTPVAGGEAINAKIVYSVDSQVAGLLPSSIVPGTYAVRVTCNGKTSAPQNVVVVSRSFGIATVNSSGTGLAQATVGNVNDGLSLTRFTSGSVSFGGFTWTLTPSHPGDTLVLWGTGGGGDPANDTGGTSGDQTAAGRFLVTAGDRQITPLYAGAASGYPGLWQINFTLPTDITPDCFTFVQVHTGGELSNGVTIPIAPVGQNACSDPQLSQASLAKMDAGGTVTVATFGISKLGVTTTGAATESASGTVARFTSTEWTLTKSGPRIGACTVSDRTFPAGGKDPAAAEGFLDAGVLLLLSGPNLAAGFAVVSTASATGPAYVAQPPVGSLVGGTYMLAGRGGTQVGAFTASTRFPDSFAVPGFDSLTTIDRSKPLTINWTGSGANQVFILISTATVVGSNRHIATISCYVEPGPGTYSVPPAALAYLQPAAASGSTSTGTVAVEAISAPGAFTASLVGGGQTDIGVFGATLGLSKNVAVQ